MCLEKGFKVLHASGNNNTALQKVKLSLTLEVATKKVNINARYLNVAQKLKIIQSFINPPNKQGHPIEKFFRDRLPFVWQASTVQSRSDQVSVALKISSSVFIIAWQEVLLEGKWISVLESRMCTDQRKDTREESLMVSKYDNISLILCSELEVR